MKAETSNVQRPTSNVQLQESDYRTTPAGHRRFKYPMLYRLTFHVQNLLRWMGISWHNSFSDECTHDFSCCARKPPTQNEQA